MCVYIYIYIYIYRNIVAHHPYRRRIRDEQLAESNSCRGSSSSQTPLRQTTYQINTWRPIFILDASDIQLIIIIMMILSSSNTWAATRPGWSRDASGIGSGFSSRLDSTCSAQHREWGVHCSFVVDWATTA